MAAPHARVPIARPTARAARYQGHRCRVWCATLVRVWRPRLTLSRSLQVSRMHRLAGASHRSSRKVAWPSARVVAVLDLGHTSRSFRRRPTRITGPGLVTGRRALVLFWMLPAKAILRARATTQGEGFLLLLVPRSAVAR